jgi:hypothetical protein
MSDLLQKDLPLLIAAALSPVILGGDDCRSVLDAPDHPAGACLPGGDLGRHAYRDPDRVPLRIRHPPGSSLEGKIGGSIDIALGAVLIIIGLVTLVKTPESG